VKVKGKGKRRNVFFIVGNVLDQMRELNIMIYTYLEWNRYHFWNLLFPPFYL